MSTYYSILSAQIRPEIQEKITIGFLMIGNGRVIFEYSPNKLSIAKNLLSNDAYFHLKSSINNINQVYKKDNTIFPHDTDNLLNFGSKFNSPLTTEYIAYLSNYSNNIINFSSPKQINLEVEKHVFIKLFSKFIDEKHFVQKDLDKSDPSNALSQLKSQYNQLYFHFNVEKKISFEDLPSLLMPIKIDLIGRNEIPVYAQEIDFNRKPSYIKKDISELIMLRLAFLDSEKSSKGFIIGSEPLNDDKHSKELWNHIRKNKDFEYIDSSETGQLMTYAKDHAVRPYVHYDEEPPF